MGDAVNNNAPRSGLDPVQEQPDTKTIYKPASVKVTRDSKEEHIVKFRNREWAQCQ